MLEKLKLQRNRFFISGTCNSITAGLFGVGSVFMTSYFLFLGIESWQVGYIASIISLIGIVQIIAPKVLSAFSSRRKGVIVLKAIQYVISYMIIIVPIHVTGEMKFYSLLIILLLQQVCLQIINLGLLEWNNNIVPAEIKGRYFSTKNMLANMVGMILPFALGKVLHTSTNLLRSYVLIFCVYGVFAIIDFVNMFSLEDYRGDGNKRTSMALRKQFVMVFKDRRYLGFVLFGVLWSFGASFGNAYYSFYTVKYQGIAIDVVGTIGATVAGIKMLTARKWGALIDKNGWEKVALYAGIAFALSNFLWVFIGINKILIYGIIILVRGISVIAFNISKFQANLALGKEEFRIYYFAVNGTVIAISNFISNNIVSQLLRYNGLEFLQNFAKIWNLDYYIIIFSISGILNILALFYLKFIVINKGCKEI